MTKTAREQAVEALEADKNNKCYSNFWADFYEYCYEYCESEGIKLEIGKWDMANTPSTVPDSVYEQLQPDYEEWWLSNTTDAIEYERANNK